MSHVIHRVAVVVLVHQKICVKKVRKILQYVFLLYFG